jgi:hypothetical protein
MIAGWTTTKTLRQSNRLASSAKLARVFSIDSLLGWTPRPMYKASCRRRKRFSA